MEDDRPWEALACAVIRRVVADVRSGRECNGRCRGGVWLLLPAVGGWCGREVIVCELRDYGDGEHLVVYTEDEAVRQTLKRLSAFSWENRYFQGGRLVAVDLFFNFTIGDGGRAALRRELEGLPPESRENRLAGGLVRLGGG